MHLIEIRELEGPNPYLTVPAIKVEFDLDDSQPNPDWSDRLGTLLTSHRMPTPVENEGGTGHGRSLVARCLTTTIRAAHEAAGLPPVEIVTVPGDIETRMVVAFAWDQRPIALAVAELAVEITMQACADSALDSLRVDGLLAAMQQALVAPAGPDDGPELIRVGDGPPRLVAITGTNGKTTTTRLVAHLLSQAGRSVGWSSTSGGLHRGRGD